MFFFIFYYPNRQQNLIREYQIKDVLQVSNSVALGISQSLNEDDFRKLENILNFAELTSDFDFMHALLIDQKLGDTISIVKPENFDLRTINEQDFSTQSAPINANDFMGEVVVGVGTQKINEKIGTLNRPIYSLLFILLASITGSVLYIVRRISNPIKELTVFASNMQYQGEELELKFSRFTSSEIFILRNSLLSLSENLAEQTALNTALNQELEEKVKRRTNELLVSKVQLENAQVIAKIGAFRLFVETGIMHFEQQLLFVLGISNKEDLIFYDILDLMNDEDKQVVSDFMHKSHELNVRKEVDFCIQPLKEGPKKYLSCVGEFSFDDLTSQLVFNGIIQDLSEIKQKQQELQRLSLVAKNTSNAVIITDLDKKITWVNESTERITGYSSIELLGNTPKLFQFEKTDYEKIVRINKQLSRFEEVNEEVLNRSKTGNEYWVKLNIVALRDSLGVPFGYMAIETDITQTKFLQNQREQYVKMLEESRAQVRKMNVELEQKVADKTRDIQRLALFPQQNPNPVLEIDIHKKELKYQNPSSIRILGDLSETTFTSLMECLGMGDENFEESDLSKEIEINDYIFERNLYFLEGKILRFYLHDITDRKKNESALVQLINQLKMTERELTNKKLELEKSLNELELAQQQVINKERLAVLGVLIAGIAHEINNPLGAIRGAGENLIALLDDLFFNEINRFTIEDILICTRFVGNRTPHSRSTMEQRKISRDLEESLASYIKSKDEQKNIARVLAEMGLNQLEESLVPILNSKNPFDLVKLCLNMHNIKKSSIVIKRAAEQGAKVVNALNRFAHKSDEKEFSVFDLHKNVETVIVILWSKIKQNAQVINRIPLNTKIFGYEDELTQVWTNIIINALQASDYACDIFIDYKIVDQNHIISLSNNGPKIPDELIPKLFEPFFSTKIRGEGTGLGLSIVKQIAEKHNGSIHVDSRDDLTTFNVVIPLINF